MTGEGQGRADVWTVKGRGRKRGGQMYGQGGGRDRREGGTGVVTGTGCNDVVVANECVSCVHRM